MINLEQIKEHFIVAVIVTIFSAGGTWITAERVRVEPRDFRIDELTDKLQHQDQVITQRETEIQTYKNQIDSYREKIAKIKKKNQPLSTVDLESCDTETTAVQELKLTIGALEGKTTALGRSLQECRKATHITSKNTEPFSNNSNVAPVTKQQFTFALKSCQGRGNVICTFEIQNKGADRSLRLWAYASASNVSKGFDDVGNEYTVSRVQIGNREHQQKVESRLVNDVRVISKVYFEAVDQAAHSFALLELAFYSDNDRAWIKVPFRQVPISD